MRHGQAQLYATSDRQRPLNDAGKIEVLRSAEFITMFLSNLVALHVDILISDATRTRETWALLESYIHIQDLLNAVELYSVSYRPDLYLASSSKMQSIISDVQVLFYEKWKSFPKINNVEVANHVILLIAHNPGSSDLIFDLTGQITNLKTSQIAYLSQEIPFESWNLQTF